MSKFSTIRIKELLEKSDAAACPDHKGAVLEELGCYLFGKMKGLELYAKNSSTKVVLGNLISSSQMTGVTLNYIS